MATDATMPDAPRVIPDEDAVVRHANRPEWGAAVLAWSREDKRAYQFEDGEVRIFKRGYLHLLQPTGNQQVDEGGLARQLRQEARIAAESRAARKEARRSGRRMVSLEEQIQMLLQQFPDGFTDAGWREEVRGTDTKRRLKRHRDPAIEEAKRLLGAEVLQSFLDAHEYEEIWQRALQVMRGTDLVSPRHIRTIKNLEGDARKRFAETLVDLLHGDEAIDARMDHHVMSIGQNDCSWQLATVLLALVHPDEHVCVRPTAFRTQARWTQPGLKYDPQPTGMRYQAWRKLAKRMFKRLTAAEHSPRDLVDVYDFMRLTARSK